MKPKFLDRVERGNQFTTTTLNRSLLTSRLDIIFGIYVLLVKMRDVGQSLGATIVQPIIIGYISICAPKLLGKFKVKLEWT